MKTQTFVIAILLCSTSVLKGYSQTQSGLYFQILTNRLNRLNHHYELYKSYKDFSSRSYNPVTDKFSFAFKSTAIKTKFSNLDYTEQNEIFDVPGFTFLPISDTLCIVDSCYRFFIQDLDFKANGIFIKYQVIPNKLRKGELVMSLKKVAFRDNELLTVFGIEKDEYIYSFNLKDPSRSYFRPTRKYEY